MKTAIPYGNIQKAISIIVLLAVLIAAGCMYPAFADQSASSTSFSKAWMNSKTAYEPGGIKNILTYGYDTFLINEDICYAYSNGHCHKSKIVNGRVTKYGPKRWANEGWSDLEIVHKGPKVTYSNIFLD